MIIPELNPGARGKELQAVKYTTTSPNRNTPPSSRVDQACRLLNWTRAGLSAGTLSIWPTSARRIAIFGEMANCEIAVSASMHKIRTWRAAKGCGEPVLRRAWSIEVAIKTTPEANPIQWSALKERLTTER